MTRFNDETDEYTLELVTKTNLAWLVNDGDENIWLPISQCQMDPPDADEGDFCQFTVPNWIAQEKGLI